MAQNPHIQRLFRLYTTHDSLGPYLPRLHEVLDVVDPENGVVPQVLDPRGLVVRAATTT